jgi:hypothetical protein
VREALRPRSLRERLRVRLAGGWSAMQVAERLDPGVRAGLEAGLDGAAAPRRTVSAVLAELLSLVEEGKVKRRRVKYGIVLNTKGDRAMLVDAFSLR